jgi:hypothetical protein
VHTLAKVSDEELGQQRQALEHKLAALPLLEGEAEPVSE